MRAERLARDLLAAADIQVTAKPDPLRPWDIQVRNPAFYGRVLAHGSMGLGESYAERWWDSGDLSEFLNRVLAADLPSKIKVSPELLWLMLRSKVMNLQSAARAMMVAKEHYDLPDQVFDAMLDSTRGYTCAYWKDASTLEEAQVAKYDLVCRKLQLRPKEHLLDIGPGWGGLLSHAATNYGVRGSGISVSEKQVNWARERYSNLDVKFFLRDYRKVKGTYDKIASVGMFEAVGPKNYRTFFEKVHASLRPKGLFLLHTIWTQKEKSTVDPWIDKFIFPNGILPTLSQVHEASGGLFDLLDTQAFGPYYDRTLLEWHQRFQKARRRLEAKLGDKFCRRWEYYLLSCAGAFRSGDITVGQFVFAPHGQSASAYEAVR